MASLAFVLCLAFPALLTAGACGDLARYRIPNLLSVALAALYLPAALAGGAGLEEIAWHLGAGLAVLLAGMALFFAGLFGGGDAKLLAAAACWTGFAQLPAFLVFVALWGGLLAVLLMVLRAVLRRVVRRPGSGWLARQLERPRDVPYGIAIAIGGILVFDRLPPVLAALHAP